MEKRYSNSSAAHYAKSNKHSSVIMKLKWNMKLLYFAENVFLHIFSETEGVKSSKRTEHSVVDTRLPSCLEAADVSVEEGKGKDSDSDLLHDTCACYDPIMGTLFSQRKIRLPHPHDNLSLNPSPPRNSTVHQSLCSDRIPYPSCLWAQPLATCAFEALNFGKCNWGTQILINFS